MALVLHQMLKVALGLLAAGLFIMLIGANTDYWFAGSSIHYGLWNICAGLTCVDLASYVGTIPGHVHFARIVCIAAAVCSVAALVMLLLFGNKAQRKIYLNVAFTLALLAGIFSLVAVAAYAAKEVGGSIKLAWSAGLVVWGGLLLIASSICIIVPVTRGLIQFTEM